MEDLRPEIAPDCFSFSPLPEGGDLAPLMREMKEEWEREEHPWQTTHPRWGRFTVVNDEFPNPPYPPGIYFEGWSIEPWKHDPPGKEAPFNYPLTFDAQQPASETENGFSGISGCGSTEMSDPVVQPERLKGPRRG